MHEDKINEMLAKACSSVFLQWKHYRDCHINEISEKGMRYGKVFLNKKDFYAAYMAAYDEEKERMMIKAREDAKEFLDNFKVDDVKAEIRDYLLSNWVKSDAFRTDARDVYDDCVATTGRTMSRSGFGVIVSGLGLKRSRSHGKTYYRIVKTPIDSPEKMV